jgi:NTP pyrophosphatase (non-canonical NTP hydrolase)
MALSSETGELLDLFLWDRSDSLDYNKVSDELADVFVYLLLLAKGLNIDLIEATINKIKKNSEKYPVSKSKGSAKKYNEL